MKNKDWINIYDKNIPNGFIAICESGRPDLLTYWYESKEDAELDMKRFNDATGLKCHIIIHAMPVGGSKM